LEGRKSGDPVYVYERDFPASLAAAVAPAFNSIAKG